jgi:TatD DNase family protein
VLFDSHCHLDFEALAHDLSEHLVEARARGIDGWFVPGCHRDQWSDLERMKQLGDVVVGVGQHPYWSRDVTDVDSVCDEVRRRCIDLEAVAIGECGLDKGRGAPLSEQVKLFEAQLSLAGQMGLPVVIHQVGAQKELHE